MRVLLDENMPQAFRRHITNHEVVTVSFLGLAGLENGALLRAMNDQHIHALITLDANLSYQQNVAKSGIAVIVLRPPSSRLHDILPLAPAVQRALDQLTPGTVTTITP